MRGGSAVSAIVRTAGDIHHGILTTRRTIIATVSPSVADPPHGKLAVRSQIGCSMAFGLVSAVNRRFMIGGLSISLAACGSGGSSAAPPSPTGPLVTPTADISGGWAGTQSDSSGAEAVFWQVALVGN